MHAHALLYLRLNFQLHLSSLIIDSTPRFRFSLPPCRIAAVLSLRFGCLLFLHSWLGLDCCKVLHCSFSAVVSERVPLSLYFLKCSCWGSPIEFWYQEYLRTLFQSSSDCPTEMSSSGCYYSGIGHRYKVSMMQLQQAASPYCLLRCRDVPMLY